MQLSHAIELGHGLKKFDSSIWLSEDGSCGCAFGGAILAIGQLERFNAELIRRPDDHTEFEDPLDVSIVHREWPWLTAQHLKAISVFAWGIEDGDATLEDLLAYVRSVEPAETSTASILDREEEQVTA